MLSALRFYYFHDAALERNVVEMIRVVQGILPLQSDRQVQCRPSGQLVSRQ
jgi:hypothetical protein